MFHTCGRVTRLPFQLGSLWMCSTQASRESLEVNAAQRIPEFHFKNLPLLFSFRLFQALWWWSATHDTTITTDKERSIQEKSVMLYESDLFIGKRQVKKSTIRREGYKPPHAGAERPQWVMVRDISTPHQNSCNKKCKKGHNNKREGCRPPSRESYLFRRTVIFMKRPHTMKEDVTTFAIIQVQNLATFGTGIPYYHGRSRSIRWGPTRHTYSLYFL